MRKHTTFALVVLNVVAMLLCASAWATSLHVDSHANIFGAGQGASGNGGGIDPPVFNFSPGSGQVLTFESVTGLANCGCPFTTGPDGAFGFGPLSPAYILGKISGFSADFGSYTMFLTGVFLDGGLPASAPPPLHFSDGSFSDLFPVLGQVFFVGDGLTGTGTGAMQRFHPPSTATRLFLGFIDAPGFWGDNSGAFDATFTIATPEPASLFLVASGLGWLVALRRGSGQAWRLKL